MVRAGLARAVALAAAGALVGWGLTAPASADPLTPPASPSPTPSTLATATPELTPTPTASPVPSASSSASSAGPATSAASTGSALSLTVGSSDGPVAGAFYEDLGSYAFSGTTDLPDGSTVQVQRRGGTGTWTTVASADTTGGAYAVSLPVERAGEATFRAYAQGTEGAELTSGSVSVTVQDATVALAVPDSVDSLRDAPVTGTVVPARAGVAVNIDVRRGTSWRRVARVTTAADGTFAAGVTYGKSHLAGYDLRATYRALNRDRYERSGSERFTRIAVLDPEVDGTSGADVKKTYRKGCPVGPSKLSTIQLNYYGRDKLMHRGVIIVRTDLRREIVRGFGSALKHRYPIAKMNNPNVYGGNDPRQMKANNTSGFNCRKVVGNPYKMSPHSYGIAIDVNTVQNPYRDSHGKWWPSNGKKYRDRTPLKWGMLGKKSWLTKSLRSDHFFWGGFWNPGRDYQHFEYRG